MPIIRSTGVNLETAYDVQHWSCCVRLADKKQARVHLLDVKRRANYINKPQPICI
jgi:hypothetical protein